MNKSKQLLIIGSVWPEPSSSAAGVRMLQMLKLFKREGWEITFASAAAISEFMVDLSSLEVSQLGISLNDSKFDLDLQRLNPSLVIFDRFMTEEQFGWRVAEVCPEAVRVLDTVDLHFLRRARQELYRVNANQEKSQQSESDLIISREPLTTAQLFSDYAKRELASIWRCDLALIISEFEIKLLRDIFNVDSERLWYFPLLAERDSVAGIENDFAPNADSFLNRGDFVFIGNFFHQPNVDAVKFLHKFIWPELRRLIPEAKLRIYGAYTSTAIKQLHNEKERFLVLGRAADLSEVLSKARVMLAPLRIGAGQKGKLLEAMLAGLVSVTSSIGAEGMLPSESRDNAEATNSTDAWPGVVTDSISEFIASAVQLYLDPSFWQATQVKALPLIQSQFAANKFEPQFLSKISQILTELTSIRSRNFIGTMLLHSTLNSSKYMSRWIEAKASNQACPESFVPRQNQKL